MWYLLNSWTNKLEILLKLNKWFTWLYKINKQINKWMNVLLVWPFGLFNYGQYETKTNQKYWFLLWFRHGTRTNRLLYLYLRSCFPPFPHTCVLYPPRLSELRVRGHGLALADRHIFYKRHWWCVDIRTLKVIICSNGCLKIPVKKENMVLLKKEFKIYSKQSLSAEIQVTCSVRQWGIAQHPVAIMVAL